MPRCTVIPVLGYPDVGAAVVWLCDTFGFSIRVRIGNHRAQLNAGVGAVVVTQRDGPAGADSVMVRVDDVDRHHARALKRGARVLEAPTDYPFGERQYSVDDFAGHRWTFSQSIADVDPKDWGGTTS